MRYTDGTSFFAVMSTAEFREKKEQFAYHKEMLHSLGSIRYCKAIWMKYFLLIPCRQRELPTAASATDSTRSKHTMSDSVRLVCCLVHFLTL